MAVFRIEKTRDYTVMANHHLRNTALSLKAKGLLSLMLSLPEDWDYTTKGLARICRDGVDSIAHLFFKYYYSAQFLYKAWKRFRKYGAALTAATQNVEECLRSETARLMFANSEFLVLLNQAATDRAELAKLLNISENQMGYVTNAEAGHGLLRVGGAIVPFANEFPRTGALYQLWNTTPTDK